MVEHEEVGWCIASNAFPPTTGDVRAPVIRLYGATKIISEKQVCFSEIILVETRLPFYSDYCTVSWSCTVSLSL